MSKGATTELYRHFAADGMLLYVGITRCTFARGVTHGGAKWRHQIATVTIERYDTWKLAAAAEVVAIQTERPIFNVHRTKVRAKKIAVSRPALERAIEIVGGQVQLAEFISKAIGSTTRQQTVSNWLTNETAIEARYWGAIELATDGRVTRADLRPDVFSVHVASPSPAPAS